MEPIMAPYWVPDITRGVADAVPQFCPFLSIRFNIIHPFNREREIPYLYPYMPRPQG
jgi:hypothetical protein